MGWAVLAAPGPGLNDQVEALEVYGGDLIAGGWFSASAATPTSRIARWDGVQWSPLGGGVSGASPDLAINALAAYDGYLWATGVFSHAGGMPAAGLARWDGSWWYSVGAGLSGSDAWGRAFTIHGDDLVLGGHFDHVAGTPCKNLARWDGLTWSEFGGQAEWTVRALAASPTELACGGDFKTIGGQPQSYIARWGCPPCYPDCSGDAALTIADFACFQTKFVATDPYADCNSDTAFTIADFGCFQSKFVAGCP